jgi:lipopolysaccharide export system protein LptA
MPLKLPRSGPIGIAALLVITSQGGADVLFNRAGAQGDPNVTAASALTNAGLVSIESDIQKADNVTGVITASGNVRIVYPDQSVVATARQAQYFSREARIVLRGDVDVIQRDGKSLRAERVTVLLDSKRVIAEPRVGEQVVSTMRLDSPSASSMP